MECVLTKFIEVNGVGGETMMLNVEHIQSIFPVNVARMKLSGVPADKIPPLATKAQINLTNGLGIYVTEEYTRLAGMVGVLVGLG